MNFKTFILIIARSHYCCNDIFTGMLYCTEQLIITIFLQKMTLHYVGWAHQKQILPNLVLLGHSRSPSSGQSSKSERNSRNGTADSALGWSFLDQQPSLPQFSEQSSAAVDDSSTLFDIFFSLFFPEFMIKHIKTEANRHATSIADKLRRTHKLKPHSI